MSMARIAQCLAGAVADGRITREQAEKIERTLSERIEAAAKREGSPQDAVSAAALAAEEMVKAAARRRNAAAQQIIRSTQALTDMNAHRENPLWGALSKFGRDPKADIEGQIGVENVEGVRNWARGAMHAKMNVAIDAFRRKLGGVQQDKTGVIAMVRELFDENTGNTRAKAAAQGMTEATDWGVARLQEFGGTVHNKANWRLPQQFIRQNVARYSEAEFKAYFQAAAARGVLRFTDWETGLPAASDKIDKILSATYRNIVTPQKFSASEQARAFGAMGSPLNHPRVFEWQDADAWLDFNRTFGVGDAGIFELVTSHVDALAHEIGLVKVLGPNHRATHRAMLAAAEDWIRADSSERLTGGRKMKQRQFLLATVDAAYEVATGKANSPVHDWMANAGRGVRNWLQSAFLGSATISAVPTDSFTAAMTARFNGIPAMKVLSRYISLLRPGDNLDAQRAIRFGLTADGYVRMAMASHRNRMDEVGTGFSAQVVDFLHVWDGLTPHTRAMRWAFGMEFLGSLTDQAKRPFGELRGQTLRAFQRYGIDAADWDVIRAEVYDLDGLRMIWPEKVAPDQATKLMQMIMTETDFAVPQTGATERAMMHGVVRGNARPGTVGGEIIAGSLQFKTFPMMMILSHVWRGVSMARRGDHGAYLTTLAVGLTVAGAAALQMKEIAKGRDPRDMTDPDFLGAAFFQGGGAGIFGDFLNSALNRADQSFYMSMLGGPQGGLLDDLMRLTGANITATAEGRDSNFGRDLARFIRRYTPGSSTWYARLALDRALFDQIQMQLDPDYWDSFRRQIENRRRETDQEFFAPPGGGLRAPNFGAAFGG